MLLQVRRTATVIFLVALFARLAFLFELPDYGLSGMGPVRDSLYYDARAREIASGDFVGRAPEFISPAYGYFMGAIYAVTGPDPAAVRFVQAVLGALSCALLVLIGGRVGLRGAGPVAGILLTLYGVHVFYTGILLPTVLVTFLNLFLLWLVSDWRTEPSPARCMAVGLVTGLAVLAKANALLLVPLLAAWFWLRGRPRRSAPALALLAGVFLVVAPVTAKNYAVSGDLVLVTTTGGLNFYKGNGPEATGTFSTASRGIGAGAHLHGDVDPRQVADISSQMGREARDHMLEHPWQAATLFAKKLGLFFSANELFVRDNFYFARESSRVLSLAFVSFAMIAPLGLAGFLTSWRFRERLVPLYGLMAAQIVSYVLIFVLARYRLVAVCCLMLGTGLLAAQWIEWWNARDRKRIGGSLLLAAFAFALVLLPVPGFPRTPGAGFGAQYVHQGNQLLQAGEIEKAARSFAQALLSDWGREKNVEAKRASALRSLQNALARMDPAEAALLTDTLELHGDREQLTSQRRPDVVILVADDLGWATVAGDGDPYETPNIDRLMREGIRLERFYTWPACTPTRAALMTGRSPMRYGLGYSMLKPWLEEGLSLQEHLMPDTFRADGYRTAAIGKWHLGSHTSEFLPNARGFDHFYGHLNGFVDYFEHTCAGGLDWQRNGVSVREEGYATDLMGEEAARLILGQSRDTPLFLYVAFNAVHGPLQAPDADIARYDQLADERKRVVAAMVYAMDRAVGRILDALDRSGRANDAIVVFMSDNGSVRETFGENLPLRGGKGTTFEGGIRVPAAIRWPGHLPAGTRSHQVMRAEDWFPTLARAVGVEPRGALPLDGVDVWTELTSRGSRPREPLFTAAETRAGLFFSVLDGDWKLVRRQAADGTIRDSLFDLGRDPSESRDVAGEHPQRAAELAATIEEWRSIYPEDGLRYQPPGHPEQWAAPEDWAERAR
jgi:arylsulfatase A-like enzyme/4-amino-4-deoxy-L-arabinose transferase-like glycosyltransferase